MEEETHPNENSDFVIRELERLLRKTTELERQLKDAIQGQRGSGTPPTEA